MTASRPCASCAAPMYTRRADRLYCHSVACQQKRNRAKYVKRVAADIAKAARARRAS